MEPFQRFQRRFLSEQRRKTVWAGCTGLLAGIAVLLIARLCGRPLSGLVCVTVPALLCLLCAWAGYRGSKIPLREQAVRLDAAGLEERAVTMAENLKRETPMAVLQRRDAEEKLCSLPPERIKIAQPKKLISAAVFLLMLTLGLACAVWAQDSAKRTDMNSEQLALRQRMLELEAGIRESALSEAEKALLLEELNHLSAGAESMETALERMDSLEKLWEAFENARQLEEAQQHSFAGFLTRYELTRDLGVSILRASSDMMEEAVNGMAHHCVPDTLSPENTRALIDDIFRAGKDTEQKDMEFLDILLWNTLLDMAYSLQEALEMPPEEGTEAVLEAIGSKKAFLLELLFGDESQEQEKDKAAHAANDAAGSGNDSSKESAELTVSGVRAAGGAAGAGLGGAEEEKKRLTVTCYDPALDSGWQEDYVPGAPGPDGAPQRRPAREAAGQGLIPYDQVFGAYYADYLRQELPEEIQAAIAGYFDGL